MLSMEGERTHGLLRTIISFWLNFIRRIWAFDLIFSSHGCSNYGVQMDQQDRFFKEQMDKVHKAIEEKERIFEKLLLEERSKARQAFLDSERKQEQGPRYHIFFFPSCRVDGMANNL